MDMRVTSLEGNQVRSAHATYVWFCKDSLARSCKDYSDGASVTCSLHVSANRIIGKAYSVVASALFALEVFIGFPGMSLRIDGDTLVAGSTVISRP